MRPFHTACGMHLVMCLALGCDGDSSNGRQAVLEKDARSAGDSGASTPEAPRMVAVRVSGLVECSSVGGASDGQLTCGPADSLVRTTWKVTPTASKRDQYRFTIEFPGQRQGAAIHRDDPVSWNVHSTPNVTSNGEKVIVFEDGARIITVEPVP